jgi:hypothetical protein
VSGLFVICDVVCYITGRYLTKRPLVSFQFGVTMAEWVYGSDGGELSLGNFRLDACFRFKAKRFRTMKDQEGYTKNKH